MTGDLIYSYSRAQAIADGVLIDVTSTAREAGFTCPVAITHEAWSLYVRVPEGVCGQDETGRLWDVLWMLRIAGRGRAESVILYQLHVHNADGDGTPLVTLKAVAGPDDDGAMCLTVMLPEED